MEKYFTTRTIECPRCKQEVEFVEAPLMDVPLDYYDEKYTIVGRLIGMIGGSLLCLILLAIIWCCCKLIGGIIG